MANNTLLRTLTKTLTSSFSLEEIAVLCHDIGIDPEAIPNRDKGREFYAFELINYATRRGLLDVLVTRASQLRPGTDWASSLSNESAVVSDIKSADLSAILKSNIELRNVITELFSDEELQDLLFDLNIDSDLINQPKSQVIQGLIDSLRSQSRLQDLLRYCSRERQDDRFVQLLNELPPNPNSNNVKLQVAIDDISDLRSANLFRIQLTQFFSLTSEIIKVHALIADKNSKGSEETE